MIILVLLNVLFLNRVLSSDSESYEINRLDSTPYYDNIIFSDIAQILNELGSNLNSPFDAYINSYSESEENIEDLLSEYQHYLEKAHKQRKSYLDKNRTKNKIPLLRHDRYTKSNPGAAMKYEDYYYANNYFGPNSVPQTSLNNPLDIFVPVDMKMKANNIELSTKQSAHNASPLDKFFELQSMTKTIPENIQPNCYCKNNQMPCDCPCKQCILPMNMGLGQNGQNKLLAGSGRKLSQNRVFDNVFSKTFQDGSDNTLNIRIKVDIQMPKTDNMDYNKTSHKTTEQSDDISKEKIISSSNMPFPYLNFPLPMELFGYKKSSGYTKHSSVPIRKITIHKKKKSRANNNNKKHRKKMITFHNLNIEPQKSISLANYEETFNITDFLAKVENKSLSGEVNKTTIVPLSPITTIPPLNNASESSNSSVDSDNIYVVINITNKNDNNTDDVRKTGNSIETEYTTSHPNITITIPNTNVHQSSRKKREISSITALNLEVYSHNITHKKYDKVQFTDSDLLYWPANIITAPVVNSKNITTLILERENKKAKLNMSEENIRHNRTKALEQAIFGDVDWDDVDTVAPVFMSFVGKYINGVLTFCSDSICHSMKCADKICIHRICKPNERFNQVGHCTGSNTTDSMASMESIMDLPSNVAFEIVDILQDRMLGKLFGKITLCISMKCITFVASKKNFMKAKCTFKDLNSTGHCSNTKNVKAS